MAAEIVQTAVVQEGGKVEVVLPELTPGETVELVVRREAVPPLKERAFGSMKGQVLFMSEDFDAPLDDFKDYM